MSLLDVARDLAEGGYHVFPCRPRGKDPLTSHGFKDASRDERRILEWWTRYKDANVGIACGASGIVVLDIDAKHGADPEKVIPELGLEDHPVVVVTGEAPEVGDKFPHSLGGVRGAHLYFRGKLGTGETTIPGVEFRGVGSYVMAPGSIHPSGVAYEGSVLTTKAPVLPDRIAALAQRNGRPAEPIPDTISHGRQHDTLVSLAGSMRRRGCGEAEIYAALAVMNRERCEVPGPDENIRRIARSAMQWTPEPDRDAPKRDVRLRYRATFDDKGKLKLPELPDPPEPAGLAGWLTGVFTLDPAHPVVGARRFGPWGPDGQIAIERRNAPEIRFEPLSRLTNAPRLREALCGYRLRTDGEVHGFQARHTYRIEHAVRLLTAHAEALDARQETLGLLAGFTFDAEPVEGHSIHGGGAQRYEALQALQRERNEHGREVGRWRYLLDAYTGETVVRVGDLASSARRSLGTSVTRGWLDSRMAGIGFSRGRLEGHGPSLGPGVRGPHLKADVYAGIDPDDAEPADAD